MKNLGFLFVFLESCQQVGFNGGDSRFFRPKLWENFVKSTWSLNISLKHYFFHNRALSSRSCSHLEQLDYSAHSWGPLEHATLITLKWRWLLKWICAVGMVSWQHKLKYFWICFGLAHLVLGHGSYKHAFIISTSCNNCNGDISLQTCRSYHV